MAKAINKKKVKVVTTEQLKKAKAEFAKAGKKIEDFVKKNPEKAAIISAGIGAAVGAAITALLARKKK